MVMFNRDKKIFLSTVFAISSFVIFICLFNLTIDPYSIYELFKLKSLNDYKPTTINNIRLRHLLYTSIYPIDTLILGSSTALTGFDPDHRGWISKKVYNCGLPGANMYEIMRYFQHANSHNSLKRVILSLDFFMFNAYEKNRPDFKEDMLSLEKKRVLNSFSKLKNHVNILTSFDTFLASLFTLRNQTYEYDIQILPTGRLIRSEKRLKEIGHRKAFRIEQDSYIKGTYKHFVLEDKTGHKPLIYLEKILELATQNNIEVIIILPPVHMQHLLTIEVAKRWPEFEEWKTKIVKVVEKINSSLPLSPPVQLFDFTDINEITSEQVPPLGDTNTRMKYFDDSVHFYKTIGDVILDMIFLNKGMNEAEYKLNSGNIKEHLENIWKLKEEYKKSHPNEVLEIQNLRH